MDIARRSVQSTTYNFISNGLQIAINFTRSVALARLLAPEIFGVYTFVSAVVSLTQALPNFGLTGAFLARSDRHDRSEALKVHFTLTILFNLLWAVLLALGARLFAPSETHWAFWIIIAAVFLSQLTQTPRAALTSQVSFRRLALMELIVTIVESMVAIALALAGFGLWSFLAANLLGSLTEIGSLYAFQPVWRPGFSFSWVIRQDLVKFGWKVMLDLLLNRVLDQIDDIWTGAVLGKTQLGYYDRAYGFATYPRRILSKPLNEVANGTYAAVKADRKRLSQAFFRVNALLVRCNFLLAGVLVLVAPEFIRIFLGHQWLPMLTTFRLMLVYTLLDPIKLTVSSVITNSGAPEKVVWVRVTQVFFLLIGLFTLGKWLGIEGVALAVDGMLVVGILILFYQVRNFVDFSVMKMFAIPTLALGIGLAISASASQQFLGSISDWVGGGTKFVLFTAVYSLTLLVCERRQLAFYLNLLRYLGKAPEGWNPSEE